MSSLAYFIVGLCVIITVTGAPLDLEPPPTARESTPEILDLEQQLKKQAGEDKTFYPNAAAPLEDSDSTDSIAEAEMTDPLADVGEPNEEGEDELGNDLKILEHLKPALEANVASEDDLAGDLEHEPVKDEPILPPVVPGIQEQQSEEEHDLANELPTENDAETENDQEYENMFLNDIVKALKYHPELMQNLLEEQEHTLEEPSNNVEYPVKRGFMYGEGEASESGVRVPAEQMGINNMDATDLEAAIRAELMAANRGDRYGYDDPEVIKQMQDDDKEWQRYYSQQQAANLDTPAYPGSPERYQLYKGDSSAREVSKKRGYAAPAGYMASATKSRNDLLEYNEDADTFDPEMYPKPQSIYETRHPYDLAGQIPYEMSEDAIAEQDGRTV